MRRMRTAACAALLAVTASTGATTTAPAAATPPPSPPPVLSASQRADLLGIATDTWQFFADAVDPHTALPLDNLGPDGARG